MHNRKNCLNRFEFSDFSELIQDTTQVQLTPILQLPLENTVISYNDVSKAIANWRRRDKDGLIIADDDHHCTLTSMTIDFTNHSITPDVNNCQDPIQSCSYSYDFSRFKNGDTLSADITLSFLEMSENIVLKDTIEFGFGTISH